MKTPEARIKDRIKQTLRSSGCYLFLPVQMGMGISTVDILGCSPHNGGRFFGIEVKAEGKKPTPRQNLVMDEIRKAKGVSFYCDSHESFLLNAGLWGLLPKSK